MKTSRTGFSYALGAILVCAFAAGCESITVKTDYDQGFNFSGYHSFSWVSKSPLVSKPAGLNPLVQERLMRATKSVLTAKGFRFVEDPNKADFVVAFTIGTRQEVRATGNPYAVGYGMRPYMWGAPYYQNIDVQQFTKGRLSIDIFDVKAKAPVWHGHGEKSISSSDQNKSEELINEAVAKILASFPPGSKPH